MLQHKTSTLVQFTAMTTSEQIRAARGFLRWSAKDLAEKAGLSLNTVQRMEAMDGVPGGLARNVEAIRRALEEAGIEFIPAGTYAGDGGVGVRLRKAE